jgi:hypothetical protein
VRKATIPEPALPNDYSGGLSVTPKKARSRPARLRGRQSQSAPVVRKRLGDCLENHLVEEAATDARAETDKHRTAHGAETDHPMELV